MAAVQNVGLHLAFILRGMANKPLDVRFMKAGKYLYKLCIDVIYVSSYKDGD
jgi:Na+-transporting NADH:ubiquinone oxidoreductase subunit NqrB